MTLYLVVSFSCNFLPKISLKATLRLILRSSDTSPIESSSCSTSPGCRSSGCFHENPRQKRELHHELHQLDVSENSGTPKLSILIGFSINHPFWGSTPIFGNTQLENVVHFFFGCTSDPMFFFRIFWFQQRAAQWFNQTLGWHSVENSAWLMTGSRKNGVCINLL